MTEDEPTGDDESGASAVELPLLEPPVEPGHPRLENALFVLLGVVIALGVVFRLYQLFG